MPLVRIDHAAGKPPAYRAAISQGVHDAMTSTFNVPEDDRFQVIGEHAPGAVVHPPSYLGIDYSDDLVIIQITCNEGRTLDQKKRLFAALADNLAASPGLRREDIVVSLVEAKKENWSLRQWRRPIRDVAGPAVVSDPTPDIKQSQAVDQSAESQDDIGRNDEPEGVRGNIFDLKARARDAYDRQ